MYTIVTKESGSNVTTTTSDALARISRVGLVGWLPLVMGGLWMLL
jgi:hypothetical protein